MEGPIILGLVGLVIVTLSLLLSFFLIRPERYRVGQDTTYGGDVPGLRRLIWHQGLLVLLGGLGSALQVVALLWEATRG